MSLFDDLKDLLGRHDAGSAVVDPPVETTTEPETPPTDITDSLETPAEETAQEETTEKEPVAEQAPQEKPALAPTAFSRPARPAPLSDRVDRGTATREEVMKAVKSGEMDRILSQYPKTFL